MKGHSQAIKGLMNQEDHDVGLPFSDVQKNDNFEVKMVCAHNDSQIKALKVKNIIAGKGGKEIENVRNWPLDLQASKREKSMKMSEVAIKPKRVSWKAKFKKWFKRFKSGDKENEGEMNQTNYQVDLPFSSDVQNNDDDETKMEIHQRESQLKDQKIENIDERSDDKATEMHVSQPDNKVKFDGWSSFDSRNYDIAKGKIHFVQKNSQVKEVKVKNLIMSGDDKAVVNIRKSPPVLQANEREMSLKINEVKTEPKSVSLKIKLEKWLRRFKREDKECQGHISQSKHEDGLTSSDIKTNDNAELKINYGQTDTKMIVEKLEQITMKGNDKEFERCTIQPRYEVGLSSSDIQNNEDAERIMKYAQTNLQMVVEKLEKIPLKSDNKKSEGDICHTDYEVELQSSCMQRNDEARNKMDCTQTHPQMKPEKLENISVENDDRDTEKNMSLLDYEVILSSSHIQSNDDAKGKMKYGQTDFQMMAEKHENIANENDDGEFEGCTIHQKYEVGMSSSDIQNNEDTERNINYAPTDLQMVTEKLEKISLKSESKKSEGDICHTHYEVELQSSCMQRKDDAKNKMNCSQTDPQMKPEKLENISVENDDRDTEKNMSLLDYEVMLSSSHIQSNDDAKGKMKYGQTDFQMMAEKHENIANENDDEEFEGCTIQLKYKVGMSSSDIQNNEDNERNMNYAPTDLQMVTEKLEKISLKSESKKSERDICHTDYEVELHSFCMQGNDDAKKKMNYSQTDPQMITEKLENISEENDDRDTEENMSLLDYEVMLSSSHIQTNDDAERKMKYGQTDSQNISIKSDDDEFEGYMIQQKYEVGMSSSDCQNNEDAERNMNYAPIDQMMTEKLEKIPLKSESKKNLVDICHTDYEVELQSSCMQRNDDAKKKMNYSQTDPQKKQEKLENITVENDDRDTEENMSLLDYEVMLSSSHIQSNDDAKRKIKYGQTDSQMMAEKYENITNKSDDEEFEACTIQQKYEVGMSFSDVLNNEDAERNMNYAPTDLQMVTEELEKIPLKSESKKNVVDICHTDYEVELQSSCMQRNDDDIKKMSYNQTDPQMKPEKLENITMENDDRDTEENMSLLDYEVMLSSSHIQSNDDAKRKMKYGQTDSQMIAEKYENITNKSDDEEFEACTIQQKYEVGMSSSDIQNNEDAERNINYARTDLQMIAKEFKNITLKSDNNEIEGNMRNPDHKAWLPSSDIQNNYADEKKMDSVQRDPQRKAPKLKNIAIKSIDQESEMHACKPEYEFGFFGSSSSDIQSYNTAEENVDLVQRDSQVKTQTVENIIARDDGERVASFEPWTLDWQEAEQEISRKINEVPIKQKRVSWKTKLEKRFKR
ncbi:myb-like protein X [Uloborus diversus]|uniref:myb-like protein X n=1 Tax=Uloborus diversus TaxID=327109 RepID=UPI00240918F9|nr:myb-like protein X [Uloborus diversus]